MTGRLVRRADLSPGERDAMFALLTDHFDGVTRCQFDRDLAEKNWAILLDLPGGRLGGFSTILAYETTFNGQPVSVIYSGDTLVARDAWGTASLPRHWIAAVNELRAHYPRGPYYWLLICSGFRTYRFLPLFWRSFYPRYDAQTPSATYALMHQLARERFGEAFCAKTGVVRFPCPQVLRIDLRGIPEERLSDPHISFFSRINPHHERGDELVCLAELSSDNLTPAGRRMVGGSS